MIDLEILDIKRYSKIKTPENFEKVIE